jgi:hypothetical protein
MTRTVLKSVFLMGRTQDKTTTTGWRNKQIPLLVQHPKTNMKQAQQRSTQKISGKGVIMIIISSNMITMPHC